MTNTILTMISTLLTSIIGDVLDQSYVKGVSAPKKRKRQSVCDAIKKKTINKKRRCKKPGCTKQSQGKVGVCIAHGFKVKRRYPRKPCTTPGCSSRSVKAGLCQAHGAPIKKRTRVTKRPACAHPGCNSQSRHGYEVCGKHGAVRKRCQFPGCAKHIVNKNVCLDHGAKRRKCKVKGCEKWVQRFNLCRGHGAPPKCCIVPGCLKEQVQGQRCIPHGAVTAPPRKCSIQGCTNIAHKNALCKGHRAFPCSNDGCLGNIYYRDPDRKYCYNCFCVKYDYIPVNVKLREKYFHKLMIDEFPLLKFSYNKSQPNNCKQTRYPDWSRDYGSFLLIVECDEYQHRKSTSYACESKRTVQIYQNAAHRPTVFVRFNPDGYRRRNGLTVSGCFKEVFNKELGKKDLMVDENEVQRRWKEIKKQIQHYTENLENPPTKAITVHKLFYDGHQK